MTDPVSSTRARAGAVLVALALCTAAPVAWPDALDDLSSKDAASALRAALGQGIDRTVDALGAPEGFLSHAKVTIPLPPALDKIDRALRSIGMGGQADELRTAMNHAASAAVTEAKPLLRQALRRMTLVDAKEILTGGDEAATQYFRRTTGDALAARFKPIVAKATAHVKLAALYDRYAGKAAELGLVHGEDAHLDDYVTAKALDGLFAGIADEERAIRSDPLGQGSALLKRVFGAVH